MKKRRRSSGRLPSRARCSGKALFERDGTVLVRAGIV